MTTDRRAVEADLVREHLPLTSRAVNELRRRLPAHVHRDDLLSAAMLGLAHAAARSWDPDRGASFERHAAYHAGIAARSDFRAGLEAAPRPLLERAAERRAARLAERRPAAARPA
ncbi:MAG TPA: hypothetical protein VGM21_02640 [Actinomycetota bacterium]|jgi:RNA polymerase sigma factor for flagellar operon FliA